MVTQFFYYCGVLLLLEFDGNHIGLQWLLTLKKKGKITWIWNKIEDFAKKIILFFVLMALSSPFILVLSLCSS